MKTDVMTSVAVRRAKLQHIISFLSKTIGTFYDMKSICMYLSVFFILSRVKCIGNATLVSITILREKLILTYFLHASSCIYIRVRTGWNWPYTVPRLVRVL